MLAKNIVTIILSLLVCSQAYSFESEKDFTNTFTETCVKNKAIKTPQDQSICKCIAANHWALSQLPVNTKSSTEQLIWINSYYADALTAKQIEDDPYMFANPSGFDFEIATKCVNSPKYRHKFEKE